MNLNPDIYADKVSGFGAGVRLKTGIPTKIPTKCRDSGLQCGELRVPIN